MSDLSPDCKHATVKGVALRDLRALLLRREKKRARLLLPEAMDFFGCPAPRADMLLRKVARAGYIRWAKGEIEGEDWSVTDFGMRLIMDDLATPIDRAEVTRIIATVLSRVRSINSDPQRLARIPEVRLYGSALDPDKGHYGDVDIELAAVRRPESDPDVARITALLAPHVPQSYRRHIFYARAPEAFWDCRRATAEVSKGLRALSLTENGTVQTGCQYQVLYRFDLASDAELSGDDFITPRSKPSPVHASQTTIASIPRQTVVEPSGQPGPDDLLPARTNTVNARDLSYNEAIAWLGEKSGAAGALGSCDLKRRSELAFSGARDLFPEWRDPSLTGLELFRKALAWAEVHDLPIAKGPRHLVLTTASRSRSASYNGLFVERVADTIDADLSVHLVNRSGRLSRGREAGHISRRMIAAHYALSVAMGRMIDETGLSGNAAFSAKFDFTDRRTNIWPALPKLSGQARKLQKRLKAVQVPVQTLDRARAGADRHAQDLLIREVEVAASCAGRNSQCSPHSSASFRFDFRPAGGKRLSLFDLEESWAAGAERERQPWPDEDALLEGADDLAQTLEKHLKAIPGCVSLTLGRRYRQKAP